MIDRLCLRSAIFSLLSLLWLAPQLAHAQDRERVAVLELKVTTQKGSQAKVATEFEADNLTETIRAAVTELSLYMVMTKENIYQMIPPGMDLADCVGKCEVETGKLMHAHYIITGVLGMIDGRFDLFIKLHSVTTGEQLDTKNILAESIKGLRAQLKTSVKLMFAKLTMNAMGMRQGKANTLLFIDIKPLNVQAQVYLNDGLQDLSAEQIKQQGSGYLIPVAPEIKHRVVVKSKGYISSSEEFIVNDGGVYNLNVKLAKEVIQTSQCDKKDSACLAEMFVYTKPPGAIVYVDGQAVLDLAGSPKRTSATRNAEVGVLRVSGLMPGEHVVEVRAPSYLPAQRRLTLTRGAFDRTLEQNPITLEPNFGRLAVITLPISSTIELDGKVVANSSPWLLERAPVGAHKIKVSSADHQSYEGLIIVEKGGQLEKKIELTPDFSNIRLVVSEQDGDALQDARVSLEVKGVGSSPAQQTPKGGSLLFSKVPAGEHVAQVSHPLYHPVTVSVVSKPGGEIKTQNIKLKPNYGHLSVAVEKSVPGSVFTAGGEKLGDLPLSQVKLPVGTHVLRFQPFRPESYKPFERKVLIGTKEHTVLKKVSFEERLGELIVEVTPAGADIFLDQKRRGTAPLRLKLLRGAHEIEVRLDQYDSQTRRVEVEEGRRRELRINLGQNPSVHVSCHPSTAMVWVNGLPIGLESQTYTARPGVWQVSCVLGDAKKSKRLSIKDGDEFKIQLIIEEDELNALKSRGSTMRRWGWGLLAGGGALLAGSGGVWLGPMQSSHADRDSAYAQYLISPEGESDVRLSALVDADDQLQTWQSTAVISAASGGLLALTGAALLWLAPSVEPVSTPASTKPISGEGARFKSTPEGDQQRNLLDSMKRKMKD